MTNIKTMMEEMAQEELERDGAACREVMQSRKKNEDGDLISRKALIAEYDRVHVSSTISNTAPTAAQRWMVTGMADSKNCRWYDDCDYRNDTGSCPDGCYQYIHKDVVMVVRCKDCEYYTPIEGGKPLCALHSIAVAHDDFCSYGERRNGE